MNATAIIIRPDFDAVLARGRDEYLNSPTGKARKAIAKADRLTGKLTEALAGVSCALTRGDGTERARTALFDAMLELRIACGDVEALARLVEADALLAPQADGGVS